MILTFTMRHLASLACSHLSFNLSINVLMTPLLLPPLRHAPLKYTLNDLLCRWERELFQNARKLLDELI